MHGHRGEIADRFRVAAEIGIEHAPTAIDCAAEGSPLREHGALWRSVRRLPLCLPLLYAMTLACCGLGFPEGPADPAAARPVQAGEPAQRGEAFRQPASADRTSGAEPIFACRADSPISKRVERFIGLLDTGKDVSFENFSKAFLAEGECAASNAAERSKNDHSGFIRYRKSKWGGAVTVSFAPRADGKCAAYFSRTYEALRAKGYSANRRMAEHGPDSSWRFNKSNIEVSVFYDPGLDKRPGEDVSSPGLCVETMTIE